jgi:hypothetical protein
MMREPSMRSFWSLGLHSGNEDDRIPLFRIVGSSPPALWDFLSYKERGIPLRHPTRRGMRLWDGLSVYRTRAQAARIGALSPNLGHFVAEIRVPSDGSFRIELDNGDYGHCTIWGDASTLLQLVVSVSAI